jgi:hypothetical protein
MNDMQSQQSNQPLDNGETDREGAMARADLYKLANYSLKLFKKVQDEDQLEAWVQAKITKAADYIASVYHYLEYEMKFSEYGDHLANAEVYSEGVSPELKNKLMEAKSKIAQLKKLQAEKMHEATVIGAGKEEPCPHCGGAGHVVNPGREVPGHVQSKVEKYKRLTKATHAAHKRMDANGDGVVSKEEEENFAKAEKKAPAPKKKEAKTDETYGQGVYESELKKTGDTKKTRTGVLTKTDTGVVHKNTSYADDGDAEEKSGKGIKTHAKSQSAAEKKEKAPAQKMSPKSAGTWGMSNSEKFDNRKVSEAKGKKPDFLDMDKDGDKKEPMKKAVADKKAGPTKGVNPFAKKVDEALKGKQKNLDVDDDGDIEADDLADLRAGKKEKKVSEAAKEKCNHTAKGKSCPVHGLKECGSMYEAQKTMSRAAKGHEKYGKEGMAALAKAGKEGKSLEPVRAKYNKYDETTEPKDLPKKGEKIGKEGNKFGKTVSDAKKAGDTTMTINGKTMPVKEATKLATWKNKANSMSELLDSMIESAGTSEEQKMKGRMPDEDAELLQAASWAAEQDKEGFEAAAAQGPEALTQFISGMIQQASEQGGMEAPAAAPEPMKGGYGSGMNNPSVAQVEDANVQYNESISRMKQLMTRLNG